MTGVEIVVAPPFTAVHAAAEALRNSNIAVAAQDVYWEREGAFTGEVSAPMIKDAGAEFVIIGHSERRRLFGETDAMVNRKVTAAIAAELTPIVCVGETLEERERNETLAVLDRQLKDGLDRLTGEQVADLVVAYEPVWAIGTGRNATAAQAAGGPPAHPPAPASSGSAAMRPSACHVIYGGSVKPDNIAQLIAEPDVDGALVGGASLEIGSFAGIVTGAGRLRYNLQFPETPMLYYLVTALYVFVCFVLLMVILLQQGKGGDMASAFGGGSSQTAFGARGGATLLSKITAVFAALFMLGALGLAIIGERGDSGTLLRGTPGPAAPAPAPAPATPSRRRLPPHRQRPNRSTTPPPVRRRRRTDRSRRRRRSRRSERN